MPTLAEAKIIICCQQLGGTLRGLEELARLVSCCGADELDEALAREAIAVAEHANDKLMYLLAKMSELAPPDDD